MCEVQNAMNSVEDPGPDFEFDIVSMVTRHGIRHGLSEGDVGKLLDELDESAKKINIEPDPLYMILLDTISGEFVGSKEQIIHQIKVLLDNHNVVKCFPGM